MGASIITQSILGVPYFRYSIMGPKTLLKLLRPLYCLYDTVQYHVHPWAQGLRSEIAGSRSVKYTRSYEILQIEIHTYIYTYIYIMYVYVSTYTYMYIYIQIYLAADLPSPSSHQTPLLYSQWARCGAGESVLLVQTRPLGTVTSAWDCHPATKKSRPSGEQHHFIKSQASKSPNCSQLY